MSDKKFYCGDIKDAECSVLKSETTLLVKANSVGNSFQNNYKSLDSIENSINTNNIKSDCLKIRKKTNIKNIFEILLSAVDELVCTDCATLDCVDLDISHLNLKFECDECEQPKIVYLSQLLQILINKVCSLPTEECTGQFENIYIDVEGYVNIQPAFIPINNPLSGSYQVVVNVKNGETILETFTLNYGDSTTDVSDITSVRYYMSGFLSGTELSPGSIIFNKYAWALENGFINENVSDLSIDFVLSEPSVSTSFCTYTSSINNMFFPAQYITWTGYGNMRTDGQFLSGINLKKSSPNDTLVKINIVQGWSQERFIDSEGLYIGDFIYENDINTITYVCWSGYSSISSKKIKRAVWNGISYSETTLIDSSFFTVNKVPVSIIKDPVRSANGQPIYWIGGGEDSLISADFLNLMYFDGSVWQLIDFSSKVTTITAASNVAVRTIVNGDLYITISPNVISTSVQRSLNTMVQTSGSKTLFSDFSNLSNWSSFTPVVGSSTLGGATDSVVGLNARFLDMGQIVVLDSDGLRPTEMWITDTRNHAIREIYWNGSDYEVSTIIGALGVNGDNNAVGVNARLDNPIGLIRLGDFVYFQDGFNNKIKKVNIFTHEVTDFSGDGTNAFRLATIY